MSKNATVFARVEPEVKEQAEQILQKLGLPTSSAINMFYRQIIVHNGLPFDARLPHHPLDISELTPSQLDEELHKGLDQVKRGEVNDINTAFDVAFKGLEHAEV